MATVTAFTAERMQEIEDAAIIDGNVDDNGDLILVRHDTTEINAGSVIGPEGPVGPAGPTSIVVCTSTTRPVGGDRFEGLAIWETDTKMFRIWNGAQWSYKGGIFVCTSLSRPSNPFAGLVIYETDTGNTLVYHSATTGWAPHWNVAWGNIENLESEDPQTGITAVVNAVGLTDTRVYVANRNIKLKAEWGSAYSTVADDVLVVSIKEGATVIRQSWHILKGIGGSGKINASSKPI